MNFRNWILNELTNLEPLVERFIINNCNPDFMYENFRYTKPFIYVLENDELYLGENKEYHGAMIGSFRPEEGEEDFEERVRDYELLRKSYRGLIPSAIGRIAKGFLKDRLSINQMIVAFYKGTNPELEKKAVEHLFKEKVITGDDLVRRENRVDNVTEVIAASPSVVRVNKPKPIVDVKQQRRDVLTTALNNGYWANGQKLTPKEIEEISKELMVSKTRNNYMGQKWWAPTSESHQSS